LTAYYKEQSELLVTSACFSCPPRFGGTELFNLLVVALVCVCGDITVFTYHAMQPNRYRMSSATVSQLVHIQCTTSHM